MAAIAGMVAIEASGRYVAQVTEADRRETMRACRSAGCPVIYQDEFHGRSPLFSCWSLTAERRDRRGEPLIVVGSNTLHPSRAVGPLGLVKGCEELFAV